MRVQFVTEVATKDPESLVYLDESGIDDNEVYAYGWSPKGSRVYGMKNGDRQKRLSIVAALNQKTIKAPLVFEGSCNRKVFEVYVEKVLIPELIPGQTVILDNASFHKGGRIIEMIEAAECKVLYLPPYSPDFNPIENHWAALKNTMRKNLPLCERDLYKAAQIAFTDVRP